MIAKFINHLKKAERGQSIIILAFAFIVLLGFVGLTTDVSLMFVRYATIRRAVDSASLAAATQMRQGVEEASVAIAAKEFVEFHGLNSVEVLVETCQTIHPTASDPETVAKREELCTKDQRKLVKVTVQAQSPTVFLKLLGWENFTLQASAISETAALDVVLIMDVSESMLTETSYDDWAKIGMGWMVRPPLISSEVAVAKGVPAGDYWQTDILHAVTDPDGPQSVINSRLYYGGPAPEDPTYPVVMTPLDGNAIYETSDFPDDASQFMPRESCRARYFPSGGDTGPQNRKGYTDPSTGTKYSLSDMYTTFGVTWPTHMEGGVPTPDYWNGFVPTYDYFGCCNDPGTHKTDAEGQPLYYANGYAQLDSVKGASADFNFTDLVCQPFKGARDAVELFLDKIDFIRGDRVAFVTFDRSAFLVNPWNPAGRAEGRSHMIDDHVIALDTLRRVVGVRAEPNFYVWDGDLDQGATAVPDAGWGGFSSGIETDDVTGIAGSVAINYDSADGSGCLYGHGDPCPDPFPATERIQHSYPVYNNCYFADAATAPAYSVTGPTLGEIAHPFKANLAEDDVTAQDWSNYYITNTYYGGLPFSAFDPNAMQVVAKNVSYEYFSECRGTNLGAALREGNNALLDPATSRRFGTIWVMVLLSDGAAGASDPVRRDLDPLDGKGGSKLDTPDPYQLDISTGEYKPFQGEYGAFGVCPYGTPDNPGELADVAAELDVAPHAAKFPYCSDEDPASRHTCDFRPKLTDAQKGDNVPDGEQQNKNMEDFDYNPAPVDEFGVPITDTDAVRQWNYSRGNLYDVDIGTADCTYYDVDDYARDWADLIALEDKNSKSQELLPTIYTIGFGLTFGGEADPNVQSLDNIGDYLGEQMLRYIADAGDNNQIDNDYYQNYLAPEANLSFATIIGGYGSRGPCQLPDPYVGSNPNGYDLNGDGTFSAAEKDEMYKPRKPRENCGNYFNAPNANELEFVFDSIASKLFTRIAG